MCAHWREARDLLSTGGYAAVAFAPQLVEVNSTAGGTARGNVARGIVHRAATNKGGGNNNKPPYPAYPAAPGPPPIEIITWGPCSFELYAATEKKPREASESNSNGADIEATITNL